MIKFESKIKTVDSNTTTISIIVSELNEGVNSTEDFFIKKRKDKIEWVVNRLCDHNSGKLIIKKNEKEFAICPVHNWKLDLKKLEYTNKIAKKKVKFEIQNGIIKIKKSRKILEFQNISKENIKDEKVEVRYLSHASVLIKYKNIKILTDPWFIGPAFCNGWWLKEYPKFDIKKLISEIDYIFISHNHPDHLHIETLKMFNKETKVITPKFQSNSTKLLIQRLGFKNIYDLSFNNIYSIENENMFFTLLKSGDFREDSGIYFLINGKKILLNVDCNNLNVGVLPKNIDLLMSSFAGGASGFPLCFDDYSDEEKERILIRNKKSLCNMVMRLIHLTECKNFIPYAGYFSEKAKRDQFIFKNNKKNSFEDLTNLSRNTKCKIIDFEKNDTIIFGKKTVIKQNNKEENKQKKEIVEIKKYINFTKKLFSNLSVDYIKNYFLKSGFKDNLILYLIPTDDKFNLVKRGYIIDFSKDKISFKCLNSENILTKYNQSTNGINKHLLIKVRNESLNMVLSNKLPWEDLLIGFQCRIQRKPNIYNASFWNYFTNKYIDEVNFRYKKPCGSCEVLLQQIY